jgi:Protein of unknown function (DUF1275)
MALRSAPQLRPDPGACRLTLDAAGLVLDGPGRCSCRSCWSRSCRELAGRCSSRVSYRWALREAITACERTHSFALHPAPRRKITETPLPAPSLWAGLVRSSAHGPLLTLLVVLTAATGVIDAVSILALGRVIVANMTGNVVFLRMALANAPDSRWSVAALAGFLLGAFAGGAVLGRRDGHRGDCSVTWEPPN